MSATTYHDVATNTSQPSYLWLARHELRLAFRDWRSMITAGNKRSFARAVIVLLIVAAALHLPAWAIVARFAEDGIDPGKAALFSVTGVVALFVSLLLSQALELVTRSLYSRGDLDLVLSSPVPPGRIFAVRVAANAFLIGLVGVLIASPFLNVLVYAGGVRWVAGFGVAASVGVTMGALAVAITIALFRVLGPRRTRLVAQIVAAVVGAAFAIGVQIAAILLYGNLATSTFVAPDPLLARLPGEGSWLWLPARAILGDYDAALLGASEAPATVTYTPASGLPSSPSTAPSSAPSGVSAICALSATAPAFRLTA